MTTILQDESAREFTEEEIELIEQVKRKARARKVRVARALAGRLQILPDGSQVFIRFSRAQRVEHQILMGSFTTLAFTGLIQRFSQLGIVGFLINIMGGVETVRTLHHLAALIFGFQALYHLFQILNTWFVKREKGGMWPRINDLADLIQMLKYNLGMVKDRPKVDRFNFEEKAEYWALLWGAVIMGFTGLIQWFPIQVTNVLPGEVIPVSRAIHSWEAILAALSILIWHFYHTVIKEKNVSIFTGLMTEKEMLETHPQEYRRILAACEFLKKGIN